MATERPVMRRSWLRRMRAHLCALRRFESKAMPTPHEVPTTTRSSASNASRLSRSARAFVMASSCSSVRSASMRAGGPYDGARAS